MNILSEFPESSREDIFLILLFAVLGIWLVVIGNGDTGQRIIDGLFGAAVMRMKHQ
jgi:hypothetical protein